MNKTNRREALIFGLFGCATLLAGCGGTEQAAFNTPTPPSPAPGPSPSPSPSPTPSPSPSPTTWNVFLPVFIAGSSDTFDLSASLPGGVARGGSFGVSPNGAALPGGMTLSSGGILSVAGAAAGQAVGVVFIYSEPGS